MQRRSLLPMGAAALSVSLLVPYRKSGAAGIGTGTSWLAFKSRFVSGTGRIVDPERPTATYSEGQAWGLLLAEHHGDREAFLRILRWTRTNLAVRPDNLLAWRYRTDSGGVVDDPNNATDADLYYAWALLRAARRWPADELYPIALAAAADIRRLLIRSVADRIVLLPGAWGFERTQFTVANPSYYVFPALDALSAVLPDQVWSRLCAEGGRLVSHARFGRWGLTPDWVTVSRSDGRVSILPGMGDRFSYDAIRVPLHLVWARRFNADLLASTASFWTDPAQPHLPAWTVLTTDAISPYAAGPGIRAIAALVLRAAGGSPTALPPPAGEPASYYHDALSLLAQVAARESGLLS